MSQRHVDLEALAWSAMLERGLRPDFDPEAIRQVEQLKGPAEESGSDIRDLRDLDWVSIDNDDSRDLDQLTVAEEPGDGAIRVRVAVADVDALVKKGSPVDRHARHNTTSVYTGARIFPMLPERLSTDLTSLNEKQDRLAVVVSYVVLEDGSVGGWEIYRAKVRNKAKLAYNGVSAWLNGEGEMPEAMQALPGAGLQIQLQDQAAERLRERREERGALDLETIEARPVMRDGEVAEMHYEPQNRAQQLIEDFMIAANGVTAQYLEQKGFPSLRRVVRSPERWDRIERLAAEYGFRLPPDPNARALAKFLRVRHREDPLRFPDLSLAVVKMLGAGEYVVQPPGEDAIGHFGLAVRDYSHSTAPNRRYPDLITQRLIKAALEERRSPYSVRELEDLAAHCTEQEDAANKVERQIRKSAAALLLSDRIGEAFDALVTGATDRGTWVRIFDPPAEGMLVSGRDSFDVGDRLTVKLTGVNVERGFIDFISLR
jgi:exoribonuclease-2